MKITNDIKYVGVNDRSIDLFEGQYVVPNGMAYNSYVILDEKIAVMDTVDARFTHEWLDNLSSVLGGRKPDYLIIQHMEPDHSANIANFMKTYPDTTVVASAKAFTMMGQFFGKDFSDSRIVIKEGDTLSLGKHTLTFVAAPMVHWPEVMVTYDSCDKVLFSADGFGKFGATDADEDWACEARRYYIGKLPTPTRTGHARLAAITSASWASTVHRSRPFSKRPQPSTSPSSAPFTVPFLPKIWATIWISTTHGPPIRLSPRE